MERRLAAILAGDVVGYTRLMAEDEDGTYGSLRATLAEIVEPAVAAHGGRVFKTTGDGFLAVFGSAGEALEAAVAIRDGSAGRPLSLRLGLNLGDVIEEDGDVFGDGVNVAARLEAMAEPGGICVSAAVVRSVGKKPDRRFVRLGSRRGKNMPEAVEVYAVRRGPATGERRWRGRWRAPAAAAAALALVAVGGWRYGEPVVAVVAERLRGGEDADGAAFADARPAVAVLPFDNLSGDPAQDYFSAGLTEDIITDLARNGELAVIARNSTFAFRDRPTDIREVGRELGAGYVVEGSARQAGDQLRVVAQLIDTDSGAHLWSRSYDRRVEDVFAVQTDLTAQIVASLVSYVRQSAADAVAARPTDSLQAYDLVLRGRDRYQQGTLDAQALLDARAFYARAVELDPGYAAAHAHLGLTHIVDHVNQLTGGASRRDLEEGLAQVREAIRLEPDLALAYQVLSYGLAESGDYEGGMHAAERAVELNPSDPDSLMSLAKAQVRFGAYEEAVANAERARHLHPRAPPYYPYVHAQALYAAGHPGEADEVLADCLLRAPEERNCLRMRAAVLASLGEVEEARAAMARLTGLDPAFSLSAERAARRFGHSSLMDSYLADLAAAGAPESAGQARRPASVDRPA
jgi:adenylate cyclase